MITYNQLAHIIYRVIYNMKTFNDLIAEALEHVSEILPWDLDEKLSSDNTPLILDIREPEEYNAMHIKDSIHIPRGQLETACEWDYDETIPELVQAREKEVIVVCRSGSRSVLAARTMQYLGYNNTVSLKSGLRGWNEYDQPLFDSNNNEVDLEVADDFFATKISAKQKSPG